MESLAGPGKPKANGLRFAFRVRGANAQPPRLDVDAAVPEMRVGCGNRNIRGPGGVEADEFVVRSGMGHIDPLVVYRDGEEAVAHLIGDGRGLHLRNSAGNGRKRKKENEQCAKSGQGAKPQSKAGTIPM